MTILLALHELLQREHENMTKVTRSSFPTHNTGSNLHWGWVGLGTRLLRRTGSFPLPPIHCLLHLSHPLAEGCGLWWTPPTT